MRSLKKAIMAEVEKLPDKFLHEAIKKKLTEQGIEDENLQETIANHVLSEREEHFTWQDESKEQDRDIVIEFTDQDKENLTESLENFLNHSLPKVIADTINFTGKAIIEEFYKNWPELKLSHSHESRHFSDRIDLRWSKGLDPLRMMLIASREVGAVFSDRLHRSKAKTGLRKREALLILHLRACRTTLEILTLIENGLPDGAFARWRTLYEITVVAFFLDKHDDETAERYLAHDAVGAREFLLTEHKFAAQEYDPSKLKGHARKIEKDYQEVVKAYGKSFSGPYGWAAESLGIKSPRLQHIEKAIDWGALPPHYKSSSQLVHAGSSGALRTLGTVGADRILHVGATNAGLDIPAINTAHSLLQITSLLIPRSDQVHSSAQIRSLIILRDKVLKECQKAARKLHRDERDVRLKGEA